MADRKQDLEQLETLVEDNRNAFIRAKRLLTSMKERTHAAPELDADSMQPETGLPNSSEPSVPDSSPAALPRAVAWLDLEHLAQLEVGPKELATDLATSALSLTSSTVWRPKQPGPQTVRLLFAQPQSATRVYLEFVEEQMERTQEFVLRWLPNGATAYREIVRQQYVFSPNGSTREREEYQVDLKDMTALELSITPDISRRTAYASIARLGLGSPAPSLR